MKTQTKKVNHPTMTNQSTHFTQEERYINSISNQNKNKRNYNKTYSNGFKQSPKIFSEKIRFLKNKNDPKLFSLLDIDDKKTNARGTSIPNQYKRLSDDEIKKQFDVSYTLGWNYDKNFMKKIKENTEKLKNDYIKIKKINYTHNDEKKMNKTIPTYNYIRNYSEKNIIKDNNKDKNQEPKIIKIKKVDINDLKNNIQNYEKQKSNLQTDITQETIKKPKKSQSTLEIRFRNDSYFPKGFSEYEYLLNHPKSLKRQGSSNGPYKLPILSLKEIKEKSYASDIFFRKPVNKQEDNFTKRTLTYEDHQNSDIFLRKNDLTSVCKNGETYLFKPQKKIVFNSSRESNSQWMAKPNVPTLLNHVSTEYNILNPGIKGISNTKSKILINCENKKNPNIDSVNNFNPIYRQKVFCEFTDLTRNGAPNFSKEYLNAYNSAKNCFAKRTEVCGSYYDIYNSYKDLCSKPFIK